MKNSGIVKYSYKGLFGIQLIPFPENLIKQECDQKAITTNVHNSKGIKLPPVH